MICSLSYIELEPSEINDGNTNQSRGRIRFGSHHTVKTSSDYQPFTISGPVSRRSGSNHGGLKVSKSNVSLTPTEEIEDFVRAAQQRSVFNMSLEH